MYTMKHLCCTLIEEVDWSAIMMGGLTIGCNVITLFICDRAWENRACGRKHTMSLNKTYFNTEMQYFSSVSSVVKSDEL